MELSTMTRSFNVKVSAQASELEGNTDNTRDLKSTV